MGGFVPRVLSRCLSAGVSVAFEGSREEHFPELMAWAAECGASCSGFEIAKFGGEGYGLRATRDIKAEELFLWIPRKMLMTVESAKNSILADGGVSAGPSPGTPWMLVAGLRGTNVCLTLPCPDFAGPLYGQDRILQAMGNVTLALHLLCERADPASPWLPYIKTLPAEYDTPLYFEEEEVRHLLATQAIQDVLSQYKNTARQYAYFYKVLHFTAEAELRALFLRVSLVYEEVKSGLMVGEGWAPVSGGAPSEAQPCAFPVRGGPMIAGPSSPGTRAHVASAVGEGGGTHKTHPNASKLPLKDAFTFDDYRWAVSSVMTRQNQIPTEDGSRVTLALIPLWDMCNHTNGLASSTSASSQLIIVAHKITTGYNLEDDRCECVALQDYKENEQIYIFYGTRSNAEFVIHNGFFFEDNAHDRVKIKLGVSKSERLYAMKAEVLARAGIPASSVFALHRSEPPISAQLLAFLRVFCMTEEELKDYLVGEHAINKIFTLGNAEFPVSWENETKLWTFLETRAALLLKTYKTTAEEDRCLLQQSDLSPHARMAVLLRLAEKEILERAAASGRTKRLHCQEQLEGGAALPLYEETDAALLDGAGAKLPIVLRKLEEGDEEAELGTAHAPVLAAHGTPLLNGESGEPGSGRACTQLEDGKEVAGENGEASAQGDEASAQRTGATAKANGE
ncbi:hypothetical protein P4O66_011561 [Electrophorus voltai]|uniref:protein-histidine N-methyltransferase n=1 Tax=Electrophorus voltai TaxID=2609070 RepID=A0AAD9DUF0_9TELE|nr:hypothetical protein P4O66_011561 [Electrophorus voltai]